MSIREYREASHAGATELGGEGQGGRRQRRKDRLADSLECDHGLADPPTPRSSDEERWRRISPHGTIYTAWWLSRGRG
jgi:hypothetical protein